MLKLREQLLRKLEHGVNPPMGLYRLKCDCGKYQDFLYDFYTEDIELEDIFICKCGVRHVFNFYFYGEHYKQLRKGEIKNEQAIHD